MSTTKQQVKDQFESGDYEATEIAATTQNGEATESTESDVLDQPDTPGTPEDDGSDGKKVPEAAKLRKRAQAAESERDHLAEQLAGLQRTVVEDLVTAQGVKPGALWSVAELPDLLDESGGVDVGKINEAIGTARDTLGIPTVTKGSHHPSIGMNPGGQPKTDSFTEAFKPKR